MDDPKRKGKIVIEIALIASFLTIVLLFFLYKTSVFSVQDFSKLYISQATLDNVDVSLRVKAFFKLIFTAFAFIPIIYIGLLKLKDKFAIKTDELKPISMISFFGIFFILLNISRISSTIGIHFFCIYFGYAILILLFQNLSVKKNTTGKFNLFFHPILIISSVIFFVAILFLYNTKTLITENTIILFFSINFITTRLFYFLKKRTKLSFRKLFNYLLPFYLIPLFIFISIESVFFFQLKYHVLVSYKWIFGVTLLCSIFSYVLFKRGKKIKLSSNKLLSKYLVPSALISFFLLIVYHPFIEQSTEIFELANPANSLMKIFKFNEIPFVDFMSSHMFSEQFYGIIHSLIFGYHKNLDFMSYQFLYFLIYIVIVYIFLLKLIKDSFLVFLFIILFPFLNILFHSHLIFGIVLFFAIQKLIQQQTIKTYILLSVLTISLIIWRLDTGVAATMAALFYIPLLFFTERIKFKFSTILKASILFSSLAGIIIFFILQFRSSEYLLSNLKDALHYTSANQAHGYSVLAHSFPQQFFLLHFVFPATAVFIILYIIYFLRNSLTLFSSFTKFTLHSSLFLFLLYLSNFQRGIVRHGFLENDDYTITSTFYIAIVLFILSLFKEKNNLFRISILFGLSSILIFSLQYFPVNEGITKIDIFLDQPTIKNIGQYLKKNSFQGKVIENKEFKEQNYAVLNSFLNKNITKNQSFLDFSNTPLLYYYCGRNVPSYFCQNQQNTIDDYLQIEQIKSAPLEKIPIVVYSNYPITWFDKTDDVPNAMRQYLIAEHIYKNYKPLGIINKHSIWIRKNKKHQWPILEKDTLINKPQIYHYKKSASIICHHFLTQKQNQIISGGKQKSSLMSNKQYFYFDIGQSIQSFPGVFLKIKLDKTIDNQEIKMEIVGKKGLIGTILFTTSPNESEYMVRLSNHYLWHTDKPKYVRIQRVKNTEIKNLEFYKDIRNGY